MEVLPSCGDNTSIAIESQTDHQLHRFGTRSKCVKANLESCGENGLSVAANHVCDRFH